jgi:Putative lactococcus lactis phage r1t holin
MAELTIWSRGFWSATAERVLMTAAQTLIAVLTADGFNLISANWGDIGVVVGTASLLSLLKSLAANAATRTGPSLTNNEQVMPPLPQPEGDQ